MSSERRSAHDDRSDALRVDVRPLEKGRCLVTADGPLDLHTARKFSDTLQPLLRDGTHSVLVDLSSVDFIDSTGLTSLITAYRTTRTTGARLALIAPSERVRQMLALTGTDQVLTSYGSLDAVPD
ncbi:STAS domain-containing protein [Streptomyces sp. NPDC057382]|uniref:STAS domain-containing protein n=1 Tax=unclassified Streptomyces TaxID=2593676 RepID=UPI00363B0F7B